jgi:hypothetical protein
MPALYDFHHLPCTSFVCPKSAVYPTTSSKFPFLLTTDYYKEQKDFFSKPYVGVTIAIVVT